MGDNPRDKLTPDAQAALDEAIRIVREDKFEQFYRNTITKHHPKDEPTNPKPTDPKPTDPKPDGPTPPPPAPEPTPIDPPKKTHAYWGELFDE